MSGQRCLPLRIIGEKRGGGDAAPYGQVTSCAVRRDDVGIVPYGGDKREKEPSDFGF